MKRMLAFMLFISVFMLQADYVQGASLNIGTRKTTDWTELVVIDNVGTWLKCNGQEVAVEDYPNVTEIPDTVYKTSITPAMDSNTTPAPYTVSASNYHYELRQPYFAFDQLTGSAWYTLNYSTTGWLKVDLAYNPKIVNGFAICASDYALTSAPKNFTLEGSNNDTDWTVLGTYSNQTSWRYYEWRYYTVESNTMAYRYYRLNVTANNGHGNFLTIDEFALYGSEYITLPDVPYEYVLVKLASELTPTPTPTAKPTPDPDNPDYDFDFGSIGDFIKGLVVPGEDYWNNKYNVLNEKLKSKLPYSVYIDVIRGLSDIASDSEGFVDMEYEFSGTSVVIPLSIVNPFISTYRLIIKGFFGLMLAYYNYRQVMFLIRGTTYSAIGTATYDSNDLYDDVVKAYSSFK